jgi:hypothetical protein
VRKAVPKEGNRWIIRTEVTAGMTLVWKKTEVRSWVDSQVVSVNQLEDHVGRR